jgi:hypothetical protein
MQLTAGLDGALSGLLIVSSGINDVCSIISAFGGIAMGSAIICTVVDGYLAYNGAMTSAAKIDFLPSVKEVSEIVEKFKTFVPQEVAKSYADFYLKLNDETISVDAKLKIALIAKYYIDTFYESIFKFFEYAAGLTQNEDFMKEEKK